MRVEDCGITPARVHEIHREWLARKGGHPGLHPDKSVEDRLKSVDMHIYYQEISSPGCEQDVLELALQLWLKFTRGHVFIDGNKRVGFALLIEALRAYDLGIEASDDDAVNACLALASGGIDESGARLWLSERLVAI